MDAEIKERIDMINRGEVPKGYKKTKVGIIPEDWEAKKIRDISNILRGASPRPISNPKWFSDTSNIGWVRISDVTNANKILTRTKQYLSKEGIDKSRLVKENNIIMSICATVGKPIYTGFDVCIHDGFVVFDNLSLDKEFFYYLLLYKETHWYRYGQTGSQMNLNTKIVGNENINIPTNIEEQQKIAQILSTWDKAIELKEKLIEEKKEQKKGLMQNLLIGKVRLPGFEGEWEEVRLGDLIEEVNERSTKNNQHKLLSVTKDGIFLQKEYFKKQVASKDNIGYKIVRKGDLVMSTMNLWMGSIDILTKYKVGIVSPSYKVFKINFKKVDMNFFKDYLKSEKMIYIYNMNSEQGASVVRRNLNIKGLLNSIVNIPSLLEQKQIGNILYTADKEIELHKQELEQLKLQKKGLMQLLLTGKVRVNY